MDTREMLDTYGEYIFELGTDNWTRESFAPDAFDALRAVLDLCDNAVNGMVAEPSIRAVIEQALSR